MRQLRFTAHDFVPEGDTGIDNAVLSDEDLQELQRLAGVYPLVERKQTHNNDQENISHTAMKRVEYMKRHNIQPGTDEWFALWFSKPYLTGNTGMKK